jgi:hypothetical protein
MKWLVHTATLFCTTGTPAISALPSLSPHLLFKITIRSLLNALPFCSVPSQYPTPLYHYPSAGMPNTATRNIDTVIDGQLYIGKYVSIPVPHSCACSLIHSLYCTVSPPPSPSTSADSLASRTLSPCVRTILCKDLTI